ncbi:hypothetical protein J437_LFUL016217 [Ladona fulva]|uniref:DNA polymerase delta catalytic subunit n=1 Tax=Ladona fulva TaxID=123851 RepID=A0A8K0KKZ4_LADFU|nr:hypothetical protein J437_LFUL016217 [Ladona fulva]
MDSKRKLTPGKGPNNKKYKVKDDDDDDVPGSFETELAYMDMLEGDNEIDLAEIQAQGPETQQTSIKWSRPSLPPMNPEKDPLVFQQLELDHYTGQPMKGMPGSQIGPVPIMRLFGVTMEGHSVCCHVHGFSPYLFVHIPEGFDNSHCAPFKVRTC